MDRPDSKDSWQRTLDAEEEIARRLGNNPTIRSLIGHFSYAEKDEDLAEETISINITPEQRSYVALRVRGFSSTFAASKLNLNRLAAQRWETTDWFEDCREEELKKWLVGAGLEQKQEALIPLVPDTLQAIKSTLNSEDEKIKLAAAQLVLDNIFGEAKKAVGRPRKESEPSDNPDLTDIMATAIQRINEARSAVPIEKVGIIASSDYKNGT